jgi:hypothetical protein
MKRPSRGARPPLHNHPAASHERRPTTVPAARVLDVVRPPAPFRPKADRPARTPGPARPRLPRRQAGRFVGDESSLLDVIDNLLSKGVVLNADLILALADVDLVYVRLSALLCAADRIVSRRRR